jgi:hypothetical protein
VALTRTAATAQMTRRIAICTCGVRRQAVIKPLLLTLDSNERAGEGEQQRAAEPVPSRGQRAVGGGQRVPKALCARPWPPNLTGQAGRQAEAKAGAGELLQEGSNGGWVKVLQAVLLMTSPEGPVMAPPRCGTELRPQTWAGAQSGSAHAPPSEEACG